MWMTALVVPSSLTNHRYGSQAKGALCVKTDLIVKIKTQYVILLGIDWR